MRGLVEPIASRAAACRCRSTPRRGADRSRAGAGTRPALRCGWPSWASAVARWSKASTLSRSAASAASALCQRVGRPRQPQLDGGEVDQRRGAARDERERCPVEALGLGEDRRPAGGRAPRRSAPWPARTDRPPSADRLGQRRPVEGEQLAPGALGIGSAVDRRAGFGRHVGNAPAVARRIDLDLDRHVARRRRPRAACPSPRAGADRRWRRRRRTCGHGSAAPAGAGCRACR